MVANCTSEKWQNDATNSSYAGTCSGCSGRRAQIVYGPSSCLQDNTVISNSFSPSTTTLSISFDYSYRYYAGSYFEVYLYNNTDGSQVGSDLVYQNSTTTDLSFSTTVNLSGSNSTADTYTLRFHYYGEFDYGASFDDVLVTETAPLGTYAWTTNASNGTSGWSATNTEDITVTSSATSSHVGNYTLTVTSQEGCVGSDIVAVTSGPNISTTASFSTFVSCAGSAGTEQSFSISGNNLTNDIVVTAPTGYEVSKTSGSNFGSSVTFTQSSGSVASSNVYVRLTSSASNGASGNIACTSSGATTVNEATGAGTVSSVPTVAAAGQIKLMLIPVVIHR